MTPQWRKLAQQGLFVIGHARSGTTILQNCLNHAKEIFLYGEAEFYRDAGLPNFRQRYNLWHARNGNQPTKSSYCPAVFEEDATWADYLFHFAHFYRYVGEKIVINPQHKQAQGDDLMDFMAARFYDSHFIFCFRSPIDVFGSLERAAAYQGIALSDGDVVAISYLSVMRLYFLMLRIFPNVHLLFHEDPPAARLDSLGQALGLDLQPARAYYDNNRVSRYSIDELPADWRARVGDLQQLYGHFRERAHTGFTMPQIEQNRYNLAPSHPTPLGGLYHATDRLLSGLTQGSAKCGLTQKIVKP
jgi:hypothetical protein